MPDKLYELRQKNQFPPMSSFKVLQQLMTIEYVSA